MEVPPINTPNSHSQPVVDEGEDVIKKYIIEASPALVEVFVIILMSFFVSVLVVNWLCGCGG